VRDGTPVLINRFDRRETAIEVAARLNCRTRTYHVVEQVLPVSCLKGDSKLELLNRE
jgi:hypothetical protein